jgi:hypothetical protein
MRTTILVTNKFRATIVVDENGDTTLASKQDEFIVGRSRG